MSAAARAVFETTTSPALRQLAALCRESIPLGAVASHSIRQVLGLANQTLAEALIQELSRAGWSLEQIATLCEHVAYSRDASATPDSLFELVLSGPQVDGVATRDTYAVMNELFVSARTEVLLVGYAVYGGSELFRRLADRLVEHQGLRVWFCLDIPRSQRDASQPEVVIRRFTEEFYARQWPWQPRPAVYYDARSLLTQSSERASLHAKCVVVDRSVALVTSANFTPAAQHRNIEAGVLIRYRPHVERLMAYFEGLRDTGALTRAASESLP